MRYLQIARSVTLASCWLLSAIVIGTSGKLNSVSLPPFHNGDLLFPFIMSIVSCVLVYPAIIFLGRPRKTNGARRAYLPPFVEFPVIGIWALVWGAAAHIDTEAWYPEMGSNKFSWMHCDAQAARGTIDPQNGLNVFDVCNILRTAHGCSWLVPLISAIGIACMGVPFLYFLWTRGWLVTVWTPISEGKMRRGVQSPNKEQETSSV